MASYATGVRAESLAAAFLQRQGYQILQHNFRIRRGEIDLIAVEDAVLCFIEVRYRQGVRFGHPGATISRLKQSRIVRTASYFLASVWRGPRCACRFDVVTIVGDSPPQIELIRNAFEMPAGSSNSYRY